MACKSLTHIEKSKKQCHERPATNLNLFLWPFWCFLCCVYSFVKFAFNLSLSPCFDNQQITNTYNGVNEAQNTLKMLRVSSSLRDLDYMYLKLMHRYKSIIHTWSKIPLKGASSDLQRVLNNECISFRCYMA